MNYHSAAELLLHGIGWQVATPSPDDVLYEAMVGDDANPAVPGYDPDISAELYTTNGDTDSHMQEAYGTLGFTPEMATCESASDANPDDQWEAERLQQRLRVPRRRGARPGRVRAQRPVRAGRRRLGARSGRPAVGRRARQPRLRGRLVRRVLRRPADGRRHRQAGDPGHADVLPDQRRPDTPGARARVARRRALRVRERRLLRRAARHRPRREARRRGRGLVQRAADRRARQARSRDPDRPERALHVRGRTGHRQRRARDRQRGLHGLQPGGRRRAVLRSTSTPTSRRSPMPATPPTCGTSTPRACPTTSAC